VETAAFVIQINDFFNNDCLFYQKNLLKSLCHKILLSFSEKLHTWGSVKSIALYENDLFKEQVPGDFLHKNLFYKLNKFISRFFRDAVSNPVLEPSNGKHLLTY